MTNWQPRRSAEIMEQIVGDEILLLGNNGQTVHVLNATAYAIWQLCDGQHNQSGIEAGVRDQFELPAEHDLAQDVTQTLVLFSEKGLVS